MARKAKAVDTFALGEMAPYVEDSAKFAEQEYPDFNVALDHAIYLNSILPEDWYMRQRRARLNELKTNIANGHVVSDLNHWHKQEVYSTIMSHDGQVAAKLDNKFHEWYKNNPQFEGAYQACKENRWIGYLVEGKQYTWEEAAKKGWNMTPPNFHTFRQAMRQSDTRSYMETHRQLPFEEGDIVFLRKPYAGKWDYDPFPTIDRNDTRLGTVLSVTDDTKGWRASKGSRYIDVLWIGTPNQKKKVPVRCLKLSARAGRSK
jgi:hypothetical protein